MDLVTFIVSFFAGLAAAITAGAASGLWIGRQALGAELAAYMGSFYGLLSGTSAVIAGFAVYALI